MGGVGGDVAKDDLNGNETMVYYDTEDIPQDEVEASIILPSGILDLISDNKPSKKPIMLCKIVFFSS